MSSPIRTVWRTVWRDVTSSRPPALHSRHRVKVICLTLLALCVTMLSYGCAMVPLQDSPQKPPRFYFTDVHRVPLAYGGGVCPSSTRHTHGYPPTPIDAFKVTDEGARDSHTFVAFFDPHPHHERTCFRDAWHLHHRMPQKEGIVFDDEVQAFRAADRSFFSDTP